jgi:hypothetical protein
MRPLIFALLALPSLAAADASAPAATGSSSDVTMRLELLPSGRPGVRYRITHTFHGRAPARFATGAADRNCESPVDVLVVDGKVVPLSSNVPCEGLAFTSSKELTPGESWTIEGTTFLPNRARTVAARYAPTERDLLRVEPYKRQRPNPKWWTGRSESPRLPAHALNWTAQTPQDAWNAFLTAMMTDPAAVSRYSTQRGILSIFSPEKGEPPATVALRRWGNGWADWELRWQPIHGDRVEARLGPVEKEHSLAFVREGGTWRLDEWSPGE